MGYARELSIRGLSVTIPHKETIVPLCTHTDQAVDHIGAANTVVIDGYDRRAFNTDAQSVLDSIDMQLGHGGDLDVLTGTDRADSRCGRRRQGRLLCRPSCRVNIVVSSKTMSRAQELANKWQG